MNYCIELLPFAFTVCKVPDLRDVHTEIRFTFLSVTDTEFSLLCPTDSVPEDTESREDGWRGFRISGSMEFSLVGVMAELSSLLAEHDISLLAESTYDTDYIFVKEENWERAVSLLEENGCTISAL